MAGGASSKSNPPRGGSRKRVEAETISLKRARDGSAFTRCEACNKDVPVGLIDMHSCSLDSKIRINLEAQVTEITNEVKKPVERYLMRLWSLSYEAIDDLWSLSYEAIDDSKFVGDLSSETFTFKSPGKRSVSVPKILFGCSHHSQGTFSANGGGLVGLGGGALSLVPQLGSSIDGLFSYCLVPYDENTTTSSISFGDNAKVIGDGAVSTTLFKGDADTFYFLSLKQLAVGDETVEVSSSTGGGSSSDANIIIDSGTTLTFLFSDEVAQLQSILDNKIKLPKARDPSGTFELCYDTTLASSSSEDAFPDITFKFAEADVVLKPSNTFAQISDDIACLTIVSSDGLEMAIYGNWAQQNFHVGYDLVNKKLSFAPTDCTKF